MKIAEIRAKDNANLSSMLIDLKREAFNLRFQGKYQPLENPSRLRIVRKMVAKIKTVINERNKQAGNK